jgi:hypothetical protein
MEETIGDAGTCWHVFPAEAEEAVITLPEAVVLILWKYAAKP